MDKETARLRAKYKYIVMWGIELQSFPYYIDDEVHRAETDKAPVDAIYKKDDGSWAVAGDIKNPSIRSKWRLPKLD